jgi:hypothetical protein
VFLGIRFTAADVMVQTNSRSLDSSLRSSLGMTNQRLRLSLGMTNLKIALVARDDTPNQSTRCAVSSNYSLGRVAVFLLQILGEHAVGIDLDELRCTGSQDFSFAIANLGCAVMLAAVHAHLPTFDDERFE